MTPKEYELFIKEDFEQSLKSNLGKVVEVKHLQKLTSPDNISHKVDLCYDFELAGVKYLTIVECKQWNKKVTRHEVKAFKSVRDDLRAHKAIMVTNIGYDSGALEFAEKHGIALFKITQYEREEYHHYDGGHNIIKENLVSESKVEYGLKKEDLIINGFFYPEDKAIYDFIARTYGKDLALLILKVQIGEHDLDDPSPHLPKNLISTIHSIDTNNWLKGYSLIESAGLGKTLNNSMELRSLNIIIWSLQAVLHL